MNIEINNKIDEAFYNLYLEADLNDIKDSLKNDIQNISEYEKKKKQIIFFAKAKLKQEYNKELVNLASLFQEAIVQKIEKPISILKQIVQGSQMNLSFYNNLDKLTKEDIIELIRDKNLIELIEKLEENGKSL